MSSLHELADEGFRQRVTPVTVARGTDREVAFGDLAERLPVLLGPCAVEGHDALLGAASTVAEMARDLDAPAVFKASFDKANRSAGDSFRSIGFEPALDALRAAGEATGMPLVTDVHEPWQCERVAEVVDLLQIPAFLCRQTDLLQAAAATGLPVAIKKGQFLAPEDMLRAVDKVRTHGDGGVFVIERGTSFGYNNLVVDYRAVAVLRGAGVPLVFDATHSLQLPGGGKETGGARRFAETLARAAVAAGVDGLFLEVHPDPPNALSDATTQLPPSRAKALLASLAPLRRAVLPTLHALADGVPSEGVLPEGVRAQGEPETR